MKGNESAIDFDLEANLEYVGRKVGAEPPSPRQRFASQLSRLVTMYSILEWSLMKLDQNVVWLAPSVL